VELLFVVAAIGILAAISIPNFLEAQVRAKVSRARMEMTGLRLALGDYFADQGSYPPAMAAPPPSQQPPPARQMPFGERLPSMVYPAPAGEATPGSATPGAVTPGLGMPGEMMMMELGFYPYQAPAPDPWESAPSPLNVLTTPFPYVAGVGLDPFHRIQVWPGGGVPYKYQPHLTAEGEGIHLDFPGLRGTFLFTLWSYGPDQVGSTFFTSGAVSLLVYDPSNGTTSYGDLPVCGP